MKVDFKKEKIKGNLIKSRRYNEVTALKLSQNSPFAFSRDGKKLPYSINIIIIITSNS